MIIQCKACKTKFRFDDADFTGEGVWLRCSRCQNLFFQMTPPGLETKKVDAAPEPFVDREPPMDRESYLDREILPAAVEEPAPPEEPRKKSSALTWVLGLILIILIAVAAAVYLYPAVGDMLLKPISTVFPGLVQTESGAPVVGPAQVRISDLKQRFVENAMMGNIRVVEGMAANGSPEPMTRIKVRADLYDMLGTPVRQGVSYCGNLLTDQELKTATEEQIVRKLSVPQGTDISNDRVTPNGMIPFMIVFLREPPGVTKTMVFPMEAERLLP